MPNNYYNNGRQGGPVGDWGNYQGYQQPGNINFGPGYGPQQNYNQIQQTPMAPRQQEFVQGEAGANAFPMPPGCNFIILWEADPNVRRFYIKQVDQNGRPLPLESYDYERHVDPPAVQQSDLNNYVTVDQLQAAMQASSNYVTQDQLKELIGKLSVGSQGRIILDESGI